MKLSQLSRSRCLLVAGTISLVFASNTCHAWGDEGHEVVGAVAEHYLKPAVKKKVEALLAGDTSGLTTDKSIASEATWADKFRDSDRGGANVHYNRTHEWHFADIEIHGGSVNAACFGSPPLPTGTLASEGPAHDCVIDKIGEFILELKSPTTSTAERRLALQFLLHFIGDVHQPLHASDDHDAGGNDKTVKGEGIGTNKLHHDWDTQFVKRLGSDPAAVAAALIAKITASEKAQWSKGDASTWARQSNTVAKSTAYGLLPAPDSSGTYQLSDAYIGAASKAAGTQLSRAGVRLAWVLNGTLGALK